MTDFHFYLNNSDSNLALLYRICQNLWCILVNTNTWIDMNAIYFTVRGPVSKNTEFSTQAWRKFAVFNVIV